MPNDDLKKRIEALNKKPLKNVPEQKDLPAARVVRAKPRKQNIPPKEPSLPRLEPEDPFESIGKSPVEIKQHRTLNARKRNPLVKLEDVIDGTVIPAPQGPGYYHIEKPADQLEPGAAELHSSFLPIIGYPNGTAAERIAAAINSERIAPEQILFLDLETTGLSSTPVFLIGTMECNRDGFRFKQYFARDYSEEASIITAFSEKLRKTRMVVTFNGKSFDVPFLKNRAIATHTKIAPVNAHIDLLHEARRIFRNSVPDCKLQTLEKWVCGRVREDDIPGAEIPAAYHEFVRTGNAHKISRILIHNLYDLLTMADLMQRMWK